MTRTTTVCALAALGFLISFALVDLAPPARAQDAPVTLRIATLAPRGSQWHKAFTVWGNVLRTQTNGALTIQVVNAGPGDEARLVRELRAHQLDGMSLTAIGMAEIAPSVLVLQAPGVAEGYAGVDRVRTALDSDLRAAFQRGGVELVGWADFGEGRIFSTAPIARPDDFRGRHPWVLPNDPIFPEFLSIVGATGVPLPIGQVTGALNSGQVDTVVASATAVNALQWHTRLTHVTSQSNAVLVGATVIDRQRFDALSPALQTALRTTADQVHGPLQSNIRRDDQRYFQLLTKRGMQTVDASAHTAAWNSVASRARAALVGRLFTQEELGRALAAARGGSAARP
jgi:TRAP-type C4-dicarboxylate transport system substrate-binding protein